VKITKTNPEESRAREPIRPARRRAPALPTKRYLRYQPPRYLVWVPVNPLTQDAGHDRVPVRPRRDSGQCHRSCAEGRRSFRVPYPRRCPGEARRRARRGRILACDRIHLRGRPRASRRGRQAGDPQVAAHPRRRTMRRAGRRRRRQVRNIHQYEGAFVARTVGDDPARRRRFTASPRSGSSYIVTDVDPRTRARHRRGLDANARSLQRRRPPDSPIPLDRPIRSPASGRKIIPSSGFQRRVGPIPNLSSPSVSPHASAPPPPVSWPRTRRSRR
jgi:hypothetical protein